MQDYYDDKLLSTLTLMDSNHQQMSKVVLSKEEKEEKVEFMSLSWFSPFTSSTRIHDDSDSCSECRRMQKQASLLHLENEKLIKQNQLLEMKMTDISEKMDQLRAEKDALSSQVEELTRELFEEANRMVAAERRHCEELMRVNVDLMRQLQKQIYSESSY
jgi:hypothetical protein